MDKKPSYSELSCLVDHFLIAMPTTDQADVFDCGVVYICEHTEEGALGLMINRPTDLDLASLFERLEFTVKPPLKVPYNHVFYGGPMQTDRGVVLHSATHKYISSVEVGDDLVLTTSKDVLEKIALGEGPEKCLVALGYAGWGPGQLEDELASNAWITVKADYKIIFEKEPISRYQAALALLGINLLSLSGDIGHA